MWEKEGGVLCFNVNCSPWNRCKKAHSNVSGDMAKSDPMDERFLEGC